MSLKRKHVLQPNVTHFITMICFQFYQIDNTIFTKLRGKQCKCVAHHVKLCENQQTPNKLHNGDILHFDYKKNEFDNTEKMITNKELRFC